jgi:hypothetical protein
MMDDSGKIDTAEIAALVFGERAPMVKRRVQRAAGEFPFSRQELMAGLRRYLADPTLRLNSITPIPLPLQMPSSSFGDSGTLIRAFACTVLLDGDEFSLPLILKEPPITPQGRVLSAVGQRELGVYRQLASHLPFLVPGLVAGDSGEGWIVIEALTGVRPPQDWSIGDYDEAIDNLVALHDYFYGLQEDLNNYAWLARPFDADYAETIEIAANCALLLGLYKPSLPFFAETSQAEFLQVLIQAADQIAAPLMAETFTLVHGDYWPGNIGCLIDGRQMVFDWQLAAIAPAVLDLVSFAQATQMQLQPAIDMPALIQRYRERFAKAAGIVWSDPHFELLWDHALMWRFMVNWLPKLARTPIEQYLPIDAQFRRVWFEPVKAAMIRRGLLH